MTYRVNDHVSIAIYIEGKELPLDTGNSLHLLHIVGGALMTLPTLHFHFTDLLNVVPALGLQDGSRIQITLNSIVTMERYFRVYSWARTPAGTGFSYTVDGYWDAPKFWLGSTQASIRASSHDAIAQISKECGLKVYSGNTRTSDTMNWSPGNSTFGQFAREIARHGYVDDYSHMVFGVDTLGLMRYIDVNRNPPPSTSVGYTSSVEDTNFRVISDFKPTNKSGIHNTLVGYRHVRYPQLIPSNSIADQKAPIQEVKLDPPDSRFPVINSGVRDIQGRGTISYAPLDFGNVHPKYERAKYQNTRFNMLNSIKGEFVFSYQSPWELGDNFKYVSPPELNSTSYDGEFTVGTKVIYITGGTYQEKVIAFKNGLEL
jgi:hypothetical protein